MTDDELSQYNLVAGEKTGYVCYINVMLKTKIFESSLMVLTTVIREQLWTQNWDFIQFLCFSIIIIM